MKLKSLILFLALFGCSENENSIASSELMHRNFNSDELKKMELILDFFESSICKAKSEDFKDKEKCYYQLYEDLKYTRETGGLIEFNFSNNKKQLLRSQLGGFFYEIWEYEESKLDSVPLRRLTVNPDGKYIDFLEDIGIENNDLYFFTASMKKEGTYNTPIIWAMMLEPNLLDFSKVESRVIIAIHYLTIAYWNND
jgi:hypothetical protein